MQPVVHIHEVQGPHPILHLGGLLLWDRLPEAPPLHQEWVRAVTRTHLKEIFMKKKNIFLIFLGSTCCLSFLLIIMSLYYVKLSICIM